VIGLEAAAAVSSALGNTVLAGGLPKEFVRAGRRKSIAKRFNLITEVGAPRRLYCTP
jgi:hypothetical protein